MHSVIAKSNYAYEWIAFSAQILLRQTDIVILSLADIRSHEVWKSFVQGVSAQSQLTNDVQNFQSVSSND